MTVQEFFDKNAGLSGTLHIFPRIYCADGFNISVQAHSGAYCSPRDGQGPWSLVECGYPSAEPELIMQYAEDKENPTATAYGYVPIDLVDQLLELHGGISA